MTVDEFRKFANSYRIFPQVDIEDGLQLGIEKLFRQIADCTNSIHFKLNSDPRVINEKFNCSFLNETLMEAIVKIENETPIVFSLMETEDDCIEIELEYCPRKLTFEEAIRYRCAHPE